VAEESSQLDAAKTAKLPEKRAEFKAGETIAELDARSKLEVDRKQAEADADKRVAELKAEKDKGVTKLEADRNARIEKEKYQAMIDEGVPKVKADALMADWTASKKQRDAAATEAVENAIKAEIDKVKKLAKDPGYIAGKKTLSVADSAGNIAEINAREAARDKKEKTEKARNTIEMERQIKETEKEMGRILGIGDPKKIPDEINYLESQAKKGDKNAIDKLARLKPLNEELNNLSRDLRSYKRGGSDSGSQPEEKPTYKKGEERTIESGPNKGKTVKWDGNGWVLKQ
jgi:multidrug efflux pump subunit AcrA (membrane-fusion protein)